MAYSNSMTSLLNKLERRLGTALLNLPEKINKQAWAEIIIEDTLTTFSRYYPHVIPYTVNALRDASPKREGFYHINEDLIPGDVKIYGVRDVNLRKLMSNSIHGGEEGQGVFLPIYDQYSFSPMDIMQAQVNADLVSLMNTGIFPEYVHPHMIVIRGSLDNKIVIPSFTIELLVKHAESLHTISPTMMETFEKLALLDIKMFLWGALKHFDNLETVFGTINLKVDDWSSAEGDRESMLEKLDDLYISPDNSAHPVLVTM